jgi:hypothetical protein
MMLMVEISLPTFLNVYLASLETLAEELLPSLVTLDEEPCFLVALRGTGGFIGD